jgi:helix-turn-helix protein
MRNTVSILRKSRERERRTKVTPPQLAERWGVSPEKILRLILSGELRAFNCATSPAGKKPRWLIDETDVAAFEARRAAPAAPRLTGRPRRRQADHDVIKFY